MAHTFKISTFGMTLIKAYEGFRAYETTLVTGQRVIGYGHSFRDDEEPAITRKQAEALLKADLGAYEDLVNENVFAALSQSQFDALVSLSFNIGPKFFLSSEVLHALNNGRPLDAAHGFDAWRKSVIDGKTYVVDALVRRRTAEKALFLRTSDDVVTAPRHVLPSRSDEDFVADEKSVFFDKKDAENIVTQTPYAAKAVEGKDEYAAYSLKNSDKLKAPQTQIEATQNDKKQTENLSPIAIAAEEVSERLDRLIGDAPDGVAHISVSPATPPKKDMEGNGNHESSEKNIAEVIADIKAANEGTRADYRRPSHQKNTNVRLPKAFMQKSALTTNANTNTKPNTHSGRGNLIVYWIGMTLGAALLGGGAMKWFLTPQGKLDQLQQFAAPVATIVGAMIVIMALYYLAKTYARRNAV
ncbi:MAG: lysozyme [Robiginitomaculum sp.]|nr:lysozyme [Robiginitomaculum sp.]